MLFLLSKRELPKSHRCLRREGAPGLQKRSGSGGRTMGPVCVRRTSQQIGGWIKMPSSSGEPQLPGDRVGSIPPREEQPPALEVSSFIHLRACQRHHYSELTGDRKGSSACWALAPTLLPLPGHPLRPAPAASPHGAWRATRLLAPPHCLSGFLEGTCCLYFLQTGVESLQQVLLEPPGGLRTLSLCWPSLCWDPCPVSASAIAS